MMHWQDAMCCGPLARLPLSLNLIWQLLGPRYQIMIVSAAACKEVTVHYGFYQGEDLLIACSVTTTIQYSLF